MDWFGRGRRQAERAVLVELCAYVFALYTAQEEMKFVTENMFELQCVS